MIGVIITVPEMVVIVRGAAPDIIAATMVLANVNQSLEREREREIVGSYILHDTCYTYLSRSSRGENNKLVATVDIVKPR